MPDFLIRIKIPDAKVPAAIRRFLKVHPNNTTDPAHEDYVPHPTDPQEIGGISDRQWMRKKVISIVNGLISAGGEREHEESRPTPDDPAEEDRNGP